MRQWSADIKRFVDDWPTQGAEVLARSVDDALREATGDGGFSHGTELGRASVEVEGGRTTADVVAAGSARVWGILEGGTTAHEVKAKPGKVLATPAGPRRRVRVGGVRPRRTWTRGVESGLPLVERDADRAFDRMVR